MVTHFAEIGIGVYLAATVGTTSHPQGSTAGSAEHRFGIVDGAARGTSYALGLFLKELAFCVFV
jgi:hypothetical protein